MLRTSIFLLCALSFIGIDKPNMEDVAPTWTAEPRASDFSKRWKTQHHSQDQVGEDSGELADRQGVGLPTPAKQYATYPERKQRLLSSIYRFKKSTSNSIIHAPHSCYVLSRSTASSKGLWIDPITASSHAIIPTSLTIGNPGYSTLAVVAHSWTASDGTDC